ncbi:response regulator transcription factor [Cohnella fermenti]|uniref:Response regulator transcription factor n=1 Tax=Cohnella fermenti TaxID=2565925 RepID=A0A4S4C8F2_9BACL|nr:response regulator transcription factor [Cohnella fermenti]THF84237.1 response regulator transcription factor [Cohnella fermenti]
MNRSAILIAEDQPLIRDGLAAILALENKYTIVAKVGDGLSAVKAALTYKPDLVLMDIHMPKLDGLQATRSIKAEAPETKILILTTFEDDEYMWEAIRYGASGFLVKGAETEQILSAVRDCLNDRVSYPSSLQAKLARLLSETAATAEPLAPGADRPARQEPSLLEGLTLQEKNILKRLKQGKSNQSIADDLFLTTGTVKNYLSAIYKKLNVNSRSEALALLYEQEF